MPAPYRRGHRSQQRHRRGHRPPARRRGLPRGRAARRADRLEALAAEIGGDRGRRCDVTRRGRRSRAGRRGAGSAAVDVLVNNAGGAFGARAGGRGRPERLAADVRGQRARHAAGHPGAAAGARRPAAAGTSSTSARPPGTSSTRAAAATPRPSTRQTALTETLRLELSGQPVRVTEIAPGMVRDRRVRADPLRRRPGAGRRASTQGVAEPLTADDIADCVAWVATRPAPRRTSTCWWSGRSPRPPSTRCTGCLVECGAGRRDHRGAPRNPNRLRRVDNWMRVTLGGLLRARADAAGGRPRLRRLPGHHAGAAPRLRRGRPDVEVVGLEIDPARVGGGPAVRRRAGAVVPARRLRAAGCGRRR